MTFNRQRIAAARRMARAKHHHKLHKAHGFLHAGYLASILFENHSVHHTAVVALIVVVGVGFIIGDEL